VFADVQERGRARGLEKVELVEGGSHNSRGGDRGITGEEFKI